MRNILFTTVNGALRPFKGKGLSNTKLGEYVYKKIFIPNKPNHVIVSGFKLYIHSGGDILSDSILISREYEPLETNKIRSLVKEGDTVIDAGANIGYYTILLSKAVGSSGKVYAFEPEAACFKLLKRNIEENSCKNVVLINKALSNKEGKIKFYIDEKDKGLSSMFENKKRASTEVNTEATLLDKEVTEVVDFMKMDIEGAELNGLKGATTLLKTCKKIIIEVPEERDDFNKISQLLRDNKYKIERIDEGNILCVKKDKE